MDGWLWVESWEWETSFNRAQMGFHRRRGECGAGNYYEVQGGNEASAQLRLSTYEIQFDFSYLKQIFPAAADDRKQARFTVFVVVDSGLGFVVYNRIPGSLVQIH